MRKAIAIAAMSALSAFAEIAPESRCAYKVQTTNDVMEIASIPGWTRGQTTNGFTTTVFVGWVYDRGAMIDKPVARTLTFDADGRLVRASPISLIPVGCETRPFEETMIEWLSPLPRSSSQRTLAQPTQPRQSAKPSGGGR
jgi:hypothetical protein